MVACTHQEFVSLQTAPQTLPLKAQHLYHFLRKISIILSNLQAIVKTYVCICYYIFMCSLVLFYVLILFLNINLVILIGG